MANADIWKLDSYLFTLGSPHFTQCRVKHRSCTLEPSPLFCTVIL